MNIVNEIKKDTYHLNKFTNKVEIKYGDDTKASHILKEKYRCKEVITYNDRKYYVYIYKTIYNTICITLCEINNNKELEIDDIVGHDYAAVTENAVQTYTNLCIVCIDKDTDGAMIRPYDPNIILDLIMNREDNIKEYFDELLGNDEPKVKLQSHFSHLDIKTAIHNVMNSVTDIFNQF